VKRERIVSADDAEVAAANEYARIEGRTGRPSTFLAVAVHESEDVSIDLVLDGPAETMTG
jgi:hypothetical protein